MNDHTSSSPRVISCTGTADFLAALPLLTGFTASHSLFVIFFSGSRTRDAMRVDLPPDDSPKQCAELLEFLSYAISNYGAAHGATSAPAIAIMSDQSFADCGGAPWARLARRIQRRLRRDGIHLRELCVQAPDGWVSYLDPRAPLSGHSLDDIMTSPVTAAMPLAAHPIPTLDELGEIPVSDPDREARTADQLSHLEHPSVREPAPATSTEFNNIRESLAPTVVRELQDISVPLTPALSARAAYVLAASHSWWHVAMGILTRPEFPTELAQDLGTERFALLPIDDDSGGSLNATELSNGACSMRALLAAVCPEFTHRDRLTPLRERLAVVISDTPHVSRPGAFALSALVWWMCGNQTVAYRHLEGAFGISPEHQIANMVRKLVAVPLSARQVMPARLSGVSDSRVHLEPHYGSNALHQF